MNNVTFYKDTDGRIKGFQSEGHSGFAVAGEDIVCAGISALVINTVNSLDQLTQCKPVVTVDEDTALIRCMVGSDLDDAQLLMRSLELGIHQIQNSYGDKYIRIIIEEV